MTFCDKSFDSSSKLFKAIVLGPFKNLCQSGKITNTKGETHEDRSRCRAICS